LSLPGDEPARVYRGMKPCHYCAESLLNEAIVCPRCGRQQDVPRTLRYDVGSQGHMDLFKQWRKGIGYLIRLVLLGIGMQLMLGVAFAPSYLIHLVYKSWQSSLALGGEIALVAIMSGYGLLVAPVVLYWIVQMTGFFHEVKNNSSPGRSAGSIEGRV